MLDIPDHEQIRKVLELTKCRNDEIARMAYKLLDSILWRNGLRWDYFIV